MSDRERNHMDCTPGKCLLDSGDCPVNRRHLSLAQPTEVKVDAGEGDKYIHPMKLIGGLGYHLRDHGPVVLSYSNGNFVIASEWGQEAEDSPMAGGAAYAMQDELYEALIQFLQECKHL
jgi:hypothetical protein